MNRFLAGTGLLVIVMVIVIPAIVVCSFGRVGPEREEKPMTYKGEDITIKVYLHEQKQLVEMGLEDYIKGVVAAEMPAEFEIEALKAQAVAARTYAVKHMAAFGGTGVSDQPGADVSTDYRQSQAWVSEAALKARWGPFQHDRYWKKIAMAVDETRGLIITYQGEPINAVFHSTSGPKTASAKEVWGFDYPYLQSVVCNWDQNSPRYYETKELMLSELEERLGADAGIMAAAQGQNAEIAKIISLTDSGRVDQIRIGTKTLSGVSAREKLNLRSANFIVDQKADKLVFKSIGYGHGVGMSQYGANGLAKDGKKYRDILPYFYTGVAIKDIYGS